MKSFAYTLCLLCSLGCTHTLEADANLAPKSAPAIIGHTRTPTLILPGMRQDGFRVNPNAKRLGRLRRQHQLIADYLTGIEKALRPLLKRERLSISNHNWRSLLATKAEDAYFHGYSAAFYQKLQGNMVRWSIECNIGCSDQSMLTQILPNLCMVKKAHDLRFDWFINTGNPDADRKITAIILNQADSF